MQLSPGLGLCVLAMAGLASSGCTERSPEAAPAVPLQTALSPALLPHYASAQDCLQECITSWAAVPGQEPEISPGFELALPVGFADFLKTPDAQDRFESLVRQLPVALHPLGLLREQDKAQRVDHGVFGSYQKEAPKMQGSLRNVFLFQGALVYAYSDVRYLRIGENVSGALHVVVDPETNSFAGLVRAGPALDNYHLVGDRSVRSALLAYTAADDVDFARMRAHYASKQPGSPVLEPIRFPLHKDVDEALARVEVLNDFLGEAHSASGVPAPVFLQEVRASERKEVWYGASQAKDRCAESPLSPEKRVALVQEAGVRVEVRDIAVPGRPPAVAVVANDGQLESTWRFFKNMRDCEATLPGR